MARIRAIPQEEAAPEILPNYQKNLERYGQILNTTGVYAHRPSILLGARSLDAGISSSGLISPRLRHLINVRIASQVGCGF